MGKGTAQKSKVIDIEDGKLTIEVSNELKAIIEMSEKTIEKKLLNKFDVIKKVEFVWY